MFHFIFQLFPTWLILCRLAESASKNWAAAVNRRTMNITVVAPDAKDTHGTQTRQKNIGSIWCTLWKKKTRDTVCAKKCFYTHKVSKSRLSGTGCSGRKVKTSCIHTLPLTMTELHFRRQSALKFRTRLPLSNLTNAEVRGHAHACKENGETPFSPQPSLDCSIKHFIFAPWKDQCDQWINLESGNLSYEDLEIHRKKKDQAQIANSTV